MEYTADQLSELLNGILTGDGNLKVTGVTPIEKGKPGTVSFLTQSRYLHHADDTKSSVLVTGKKMQLDEGVAPSLIRVDHPYAAFARVMNLFYDTRVEKTGISEQAHVAESANIGEEVYIGEGACIGKNVEIGDNVQVFPQTYIGDNVTIAANTVLYSGVQVYQDCQVGNDCIIHSGVVIGSDGFGYAPDEQGVFHKIPQVGEVIIEDGVEIGANTTIDRGTLGATRIGKGVKLDNLVQIAHNVEIGENTVIAAQTGVSGSTKIGKHCMIGGQVGFVGHITIADGTKVNAKSGVSKSVKQKHSAINGIPAFNYRDSLKSRALFRKLPDLEEKLRQLETKLKSVINSNGNE